MNADRARDAARLIGKLEPAEWVELYGRELVDAYLAQLDGGGAAARGALSETLRFADLTLTTTAANLMQRTIAEALKTFEQQVGGGDQSRGRRQLAKTGRLRPSPMVTAAAVRLYAAARKASIAFLLALDQAGILGRAAGGTREQLAEVLDEVEARVPAQTATDQQRERLDRAFAGIRKSAKLRERKPPPPVACDDDDEPVH